MGSPHRQRRAFLEENYELAVERRCAPVRKRDQGDRRTATAGGNHQAIATLTMTVAKLFNKGLRDRQFLLAEAHRAADTGLSGDGTDPAVKP